ncbi:Fic family protein, partial [Frischella sp. Ac48]|uniref:Fic family protein n=1 Tax=Frischella sp. Ac48 TaxID=2804531 RepID=UPI001C7DD576
GRLKNSLEGLLIGSLAEPLTRSLRLLKYARIKITATEVRTKVHYKIETVEVEGNWYNTEKATDFVVSSFKELSIEEISNINKSYGGSHTLTGEIETILANMSYRENFYDKIAVAIRDIAGRHLFNDGNKRTAQTVVEQLVNKNNMNLSPVQIRKVIDDVATGKLREIEDISRALKNEK